MEETASVGGQRLLSAGEVAVVQLMAQGKSNKQIAAELGKSRRTVEGQRDRARLKLQAANGSELVAKAITLGLLGAGTESTGK